nr:hypothetical protein [Tanacetum cinerariifolium]
MTPEAVRAMIDQAMQRNSTNGDESHRELKVLSACPYWFEKIESIFHINGCGIEYQETLKKKMTDKYCPRGEIKKLEIELRNLKVKGNDVVSYNQRFQELALMCTKFVADEKEKDDKYIGGLLDNIHGNAMSTRPKTLDEAIELANDLTDQKLRTYAKRQTESKRKFDNNNQAQQLPKRQNGSVADNIGHTAAEHIQMVIGSLHWNTVNPSNVLEYSNISIRLI